MRINILLNTIERINLFIKFVELFKSDIDLISDRYTVNAKSLLGIYSIDLTKPIIAEIHSKDETELYKFKEAMEDFKLYESDN